jgi:glycogen synthase
MIFFDKKIYLIYYIMGLEGLKKQIEPTLIGVHNGYDVFYCYGKYGYYLKYDNENYSIPNWAKQENLKELFNLTHAIKIIDWKIINKKNTIKNNI